MKNLENSIVIIIVLALVYMCGYSTYYYTSMANYQSLSIEKENECAMIYNIGVVLSEENKRLRKQNRK